MVDLAIENLSWSILKPSRIVDASYCRRENSVVEQNFGGRYRRHDCFERQRLPSQIVALSSSSNARSKLQLVTVVANKMIAKGMSVEKSVPKLAMVSVDTASSLLL